MNISSYPSVFNLGHRHLEGLFSGPVLVEEKVDGSQISFGVTYDGQLTIRSKGKDQYPDTDKMFLTAAAEIESRAKQGLLVPGLVYRGEYLSKPAHNTLQYQRVPKGHIVIFDIEEGGYPAGPGSRDQIADRAGFETVPLLHDCFLPETVDSMMMTIGEWLKRESFLGGALIEGVVLKNPNAYGPDKKWLIAKYVSEAFKETHQGSWKSRHPGPTDFVVGLAEQYGTPARWAKAVQHLRESGQITDTPKDIGLLVREVIQDVLGDSKDEIAFALFGKQMSKVITRGLPEWYKAQLANQQEIS